MMNSLLTDTLNTKRAAEYLSLKPKTLANWRTEGTGPAYIRFRNRCYYAIDELKLFYEKNSTKTPSCI